jgi:acyl-CoA thioester hydrolase
MEEITFHHTLPVQIRFNDVDKFGHVNNTVYFQFYDTGKTEYFAAVCPHVDWEKEAIVVVHIEANFLAQIRGNDHIAVQTAVSKIGKKSFHLVQQVIDMDTKEVKCVCTSVMVTFRLGEPLLDGYHSRMGEGDVRLRRERSERDQQTSSPAFIEACL